MKRVLHISTECYPVAKAGGMADVVGSLPNYLPEQGWHSAVVIPKYDLSWFASNPLEVIYSGKFTMENRLVVFEVLKEPESSFKFDLFTISLPGLFDRNSIYLDDNGNGFYDEVERNVAFQRAALDWANSLETSYDLIHCHDHQTAFVPFMMKSVPALKNLKNIPSFYTIHNGAYNSRYPWSRRNLFPDFPDKFNSAIDWDHHLDASVAAMRFADHVTTVSPNYLEELKVDVPSLRMLSSAEPERFSGILNGIDDAAWNPGDDPHLDHHFSRSWDSFKTKNKRQLLAGLYQTDKVPLLSFIGRFAYQKGADLLVPAVERILARFGYVNFFMLGSGDKHLEFLVQNIRDRFPERVACYLGFNEALAHKVYASSDFILMPSRFEPCGLNQLFAMRYGGLAIARMTGGLKDTVVDFDAGGLGVSFTYPTADDLVTAMARALHLYKDEKRFKSLRIKASKMDYSWANSAKLYVEKYNSLIR